MNEENDKTKDIDEVVADTEKSDSLEEPDVNDAEEDLEEEQDDDLEDESEPAPEGLHALDFTPSESSTTNIPPRLPEGFSYNQTQPTVARKKSKKKQPKVTENVITVDTDKPLRSEPSTVRSRKYRTHRPNRAMLKAQLWWSRYKWWATGGVVVLAMGVTYPFWGERLGQLMQPKEETPVVAADTILPTKDTTAVDEREFNRLYVIFSPNEFAKAIDKSSSDLLPRETTFEAFQKWLSHCRKADEKMTVVVKNLVICK